MDRQDNTADRKETRIFRHPFEPIILYPSGNCIVVCSCEDPSDSFVYKGHSASTTIAKFSPNVRNQCYVCISHVPIGIHHFVNLLRE